MYSRRPKESPLDTIAYEAEMLDFCARAVTTREFPSRQDQYVYLEGFLLHFRNLIRFFSGEHHRRDDLSTANPAAWATGDLRPDDFVAIQGPAKVLDAKYFEQISKYLQHCTRLRYEVDRGWDVALMLSEIEPVIVAFQNLLPRQ